MDYNLELVRCDIKDEMIIKSTVMKAFNMVLSDYGWSDCKDSTSAITTERRYFTEGNRTEFSMDVAIVSRDNNGNLRRLIIDKTGWVSLNRSYWVLSPNSKETILLIEKALVV